MYFPVIIKYAVYGDKPPVTSKSASVNDKIKKSDLFLRDLLKVKTMRTIRLSAVPITAFIAKNAPNEVDPTCATKHVVRPSFKNSLSLIP